MDLTSTQETVQFGGGNILVWGYIQYGGVQKISRLEGKISSTKATTHQSVPGHVTSSHPAPEHLVQVDELRSSCSWTQR